MAWPRSSISLLAFLLVASYASATTLQDVCKGSSDANGCVETFKPFVSEAFVLRSLGWWRDIALMHKAAMIAAKEHVIEQRHKLKGKDAAILDACVQSFRASAKLAEAGQFDVAATEVDKCSHSLEGHQGEVVQDIKSLANKASKDLGTFNYVAGKSMEKPKNQ